HPACLVSATVGGLHDPGPAACQHGEAGTRQGCSDRARQLIIRMVFTKPRGTEHRDRRPEFIKGPEPSHELIVDAPQPGFLLGWTPRMREKLALFFASGGQLVNRSASHTPALLPAPLPVCEVCVLLSRTSFAFPRFS